MTVSELPPGDLNLAGLHSSLSSDHFASMVFLNEVSRRFPEAISFAAGRPFEGFFDIEAVHADLRRFHAHLLERFGGDELIAKTVLLQYGRTKGIIHDLVARHLAVDENIVVDPESVVVTVGCQEAMYLVVRALRGSDADVLLAEIPGYGGLTGAAQLADMPVLSVASSPAGIDLDDLDRVARAAKAAGQRPRAVYLAADYANPTGLSLSMAARERLLRLAREHDFLILEDNVYGTFGGGEQPPTLKALDRDRRVVYLGSFSKTVFPGARIGYLVADQWVVDESGALTLFADQLAKIKSMLTVNTSPVAQAVIGGRLLAHDCSLRAATVAENRMYQENRRHILAGLAERFPVGSMPKVTWNEPGGGFFVVLDLPFDAGDEALHRSAGDHGVVWTPMHHFYSDGQVRGQIRLAFSALSTDEISTGLDRFAAFVRAEHRLTT